MPACFANCFKLTFEGEGVTRYLLHPPTLLGDKKLSLVMTIEQIEYRNELL